MAWALSLFVETPPKLVLVSARPLDVAKETCYSYAQRVYQTHSVPQVLWDIPVYSGSTL
jgi:hypothetical protein